LFAAMQMRRSGRQSISKFTFQFLALCGLDMLYMMLNPWANPGGEERFWEKMSNEDEKSKMFWSYIMRLPAGGRWAGTLSLAAEKMMAGSEAWKKGAPLRVIGSEAGLKMGADAMATFMPTEDDIKEEPSWWKRLWMRNGTRTPGLGPWFVRYGITKAIGEYYGWGPQYSEKPKYVYPDTSITSGQPALDETKEGRRDRSPVVLPGERGVDETQSREYQDEMNQTDPSGYMPDPRESQDYDDWEQHSSADYLDMGWEELRAKVGDDHFWEMMLNPEELFHDLEDPEGWIGIMNRTFAELGIENQPQHPQTQPQKSEAPPMALPQGKPVAKQGSPKKLGGDMTSRIAVSAKGDSSKLADKLL
jgi:hypothetical protein